MCGNTELFFKNKRQKSLECVKNIISLHQLSWKQSFYLKERLIPIEDLKRSPVKAVAFFLPYISEFCDNRGKRMSHTGQNSLLPMRLFYTEPIIQSFLLFINYMSCSADTYVSLGGSNGCADQLTNWDGTQKIGLGVSPKRKAQRQAR